MLISVITVSRNSKKTIQRCLDSVFGQTYKDIEVVVVDSSDDGTDKIIEDYEKRSRYPFRFIRQEPGGVGVARNAGIENSNGEALIFLDADCWIDEDFVEKVAGKFSKSDKVLGVYTEKIQLTPSGFFPGLVDLYERVMHYDTAVKIRSENLSTFVVRKELFYLIGFYNPDLKSGEDDELLNRLIKEKDRLIKEGYNFSIIEDSTFFYEEKQGLGFFEYYKRCIWYGKPLANWNYFTHKPAMNGGKILFGFYTVILPVLLSISIMNLDLYPGIIQLLPLLAFTAYFLYKSLRLKFFSWKIIFIPFFIYYKFVWLFAGYLKGMFSA